MAGLQGPSEEYDGGGSASGDGAGGVGADGDGGDGGGPGSRDDQGVYAISVAAELVGTGQQNLRLYERKGLLTPERTDGGTRRYSERNLKTLRRIGVLLDEGLNLAGVKLVLELEEQNRGLTEDNRGLSEDNRGLRADNKGLRADLKKARGGD
ncbi:MerR family transcriptional regulator [Paenarthrobacter ureafaciens]|uniref:MerR family transcriptional regulator n=1 Tax=Paenarthrobacter ureafaciens TaxID=37931 RepID=UPI001407646E|nr:MerR family transcriptional regulator [Paenarthrobacter ureafaciens]MCX8456451.1 MerR family transcriptional regulator [Paenarthrobacter ureafaciens]MCY0972250.1 MerR family transcriptional regulator [Paenarthrobacter ureafaciens]